MAPSPEHVVLEFEVQRLRDELRQYDQELPCWTAEVGVGLISTIDPLNMVFNHIQSSPNGKLG